MRYHVKATMLEEKMGELYQKLSDGTITSQKPDGREIVSSIRNAKLTKPMIVEWCETCFCETPLAHERETVYDQYFHDMEVIEINVNPELDGQSFWEYLSKMGQ
tara:strand:+ start:128 stop:439 length:312 start_codon:yes stop_codon:yes gene_type:complete